MSIEYTDISNIVLEVVLEEKDAPVVEPVVESVVEPVVEPVVESVVDPLKYLENKISKMNIYNPKKNMLLNVINQTKIKRPIKNYRNIPFLKLNNN